MAVTIYRAVSTALPATWSGLVITRPVSGVSTCEFLIDNTDGSEAGITDGDEIVVTSGYDDTANTYTWRGFVREKEAADVMTVRCEDISYRFAQLHVTRSFSSQTVAQIVEAIVENPTGSVATGITATCAAVYDPAEPATVLTIGSLEGKSRTVADILGELCDQTGMAWYVYYNSGWQFASYIPDDNAAWATAVTDAIGYDEEDSTHAAALNSMSLSVTKSQRQYVNCVWYDELGAGSSAADTSKDTTYTEDTTYWSNLTHHWDGAQTLLSPSSIARTTPGLDIGEGSHAVCFYHYSWGDLNMRATGLQLALQAGDYDFTADGKQYVKFAARWVADGGLWQASGWWTDLILVSGSTGPTGLDDVLTLPHRRCYFIDDFRNAYTNDEYVFCACTQKDKDVQQDFNGFDPTDVRFMLFVFTLPISDYTVDLWLDGLTFAGQLPVGSIASPTWTRKKVETAAVTAGTEKPVEALLSTRHLSSAAAASVAQGYLDAWNKTLTTVGAVEVFGIRELPLNKDVTLTLSGRGITATAYPINSVEYRFLDQGHLTAIGLGNHALQAQKAMERLMRRLQDVTAEVLS
jgi:hypothetical protein